MTLARLGRNLGWFLLLWLASCVVMCTVVMFVAGSLAEQDDFVRVPASAMSSTAAFLLWGHFVLKPASRALWGPEAQRRRGRVPTPPR